MSVLTFSENFIIKNCDMALHLSFKVSGSTNFELEIPADANIAKVKELCVEKSGIDKDQQKIIFKGKLFHLVV